jgi:hypothetical protein
MGAADYAAPPGERKFEVSDVRHHEMAGGTQSLKGAITIRNGLKGRAADALMPAQPGEMPGAPPKGSSFGGPRPPWRDRQNGLRPGRAGIPRTTMRARPLPTSEGSPVRARLRFEVKTDSIEERCRADIRDKALSEAWNAYAAARLRG